ncbi:hypothetical protein A3F03_01485 [Candidatus Roizmanbacteria bacterium RIFCSPHIGHO2_12_FULL_41_11]|uniref:Uncharacterized protein n=2 Tax=Candidatus Roizmaniibacteriota TaxID=1752723 RepID=A0A1F7J9L4_9BACT|nr:MAG: hypothetical protein A3F03_01485 [Candidatus Roizmanbacteria bacterium RIFCSPHIGHO2_12_FULL_41_11]OGK52298.1 MAG: hypothetical protein A2966_03320 [Candidatus Roizmanbacteria bacterium RIFCSPLOWO2_01_FULL_41_22]
MRLFKNLHIQIVIILFFALIVIAVKSYAQQQEPNTSTTKLKFCAVGGKDTLCCSPEGLQVYKDIYDKMPVYQFITRYGKIGLETFLDWLHQDLQGGQDSSDLKKYCPNFDVKVFDSELTKTYDTKTLGKIEGKDCLNAAKFIYEQFEKDPSTMYAYKCDPKKTGIENCAILFVNGESSRFYSNYPVCKESFNELTILDYFPGHEYSASQGGFLSDHQAYLYKLYLNKFAEFNADIVAPSISPPTGEGCAPEYAKALFINKYDNTACTSDIWKYQSNNTTLVTEFIANQILGDNFYQRKSCLNDLTVAFLSDTKIVNMFSYKTSGNRARDCYDVPLSSTIDDTGNLIPQAVAPLSLQAISCGLPMEKDTYMVSNPLSDPQLSAQTSCCPPVSMSLIDTNPYLSNIDPKFSIGINLIKSLVGVGLPLLDSVLAPLNNQCPFGGEPSDSNPDLCHCLLPSQYSEEQASVQSNVAGASDVKSAATDIIYDKYCKVFPLAPNGQTVQQSLTRVGSENKRMEDLCCNIFTGNNLKEDELKACIDCAHDDGGVFTAMGCIPVDFTKFVTKYVLGVGVGLAGLIAFLCVIYSAIILQTSSGNAERLKATQEQLTSCIVGLMLIIFSVFILRLIGVNILRIPGLS